MPEASEVWLTLSVADSDLDEQELEDLTQNFQNQLREVAEEVKRVPAIAQDPAGSLTPKGDKQEPGLLQMEINLNSIKTLATWLYERLAGKTTKAKVKFGAGDQTVEFEFEGNSQKDLAATMQEVSAFVEKIAQIQNAK